MAPLPEDDNQTPLLEPEFVMKTGFVNGNRYASSDCKSQAKSKKAESEANQSLYGNNLNFNISINQEINPGDNQSEQENEQINDFVCKKANQKEDDHTVTAKTMDSSIFLDFRKLTITDKDDKAELVKLEQFCA